MLFHHRRGFLSGLFPNVSDKKIKSPVPKGQNCTAGVSARIRWFGASAAEERAGRQEPGRIAATPADVRKARDADGGAATHQQLLHAKVL